MILSFQIYVWANSAEANHLQSNQGLYFLLFDLQILEIHVLLCSRSSSSVWLQQILEAPKIKKIMVHINEPCQDITCLWGFPDINWAVQP